MIELVLESFPRTDTARILSPNGRSHWTTRRKHVELVHLGVKARALLGGLPRMTGYVTLWPTFVYPIKRARDDDNLATGVMKAVRDALVKGGWLEADDVDHLRQMPVEVVVQKGRRALELRFEVRDGLIGWPVAHD